VPTPIRFDTKVPSSGSLSTTKMVGVGLTILHCW